MSNVKEEVVVAGMDAFTPNQVSFASRGHPKVVYTIYITHGWIDLCTCVVLTRTAFESYNRITAFVTQAHFAHVASR